MPPGLHSPTFRVRSGQALSLRDKAGHPSHGVLSFEAQVRSPWKEIIKQPAQVVLKAFDFSNWKHHHSYQTAFRRLVSDLKAEVGRRRDSAHRSPYVTIQILTDPLLNRGAKAGNKWRGSGAV